MDKVQLDPLFVGNRKTEWSVKRKAVVTIHLILLLEQLSKEGTKAMNIPQRA